MCQQNLLELSTLFLYGTQLIPIWEELFLTQAKRPLIARVFCCPRCLISGLWILSGLRISTCVLFGMKFFYQHVIIVHTQGKRKVQVYDALLLKLLQRVPLIPFSPLSTSISCPDSLISTLMTNDSKNKNMHKLGTYRKYRIHKWWKFCNIAFLVQSYVT